MMNDETFVDEPRAGRARSAWSLARARAVWSAVMGGTAGAGARVVRMRALAAAMVPLTASFPQGVFVYWVTTNVFSFAQAQALKIPALKSLAGIPEVGNTKVNAAAASTLGGKRAIEQKFGAAPATHAGNPKVRRR